VIEANAIAATTAGSEYGNGNCGHLAADTRPPPQAGKITASASNPIGKYQYSAHRVNKHE
jgi:hypothetical protein